MNTESMNAGLLTIEQAAVSLGLKVPTIRRWMERRKISYVRVGGRATRIPQSEIHRLIDEGLIPAISPERR